MRGNAVAATQAVNSQGLDITVVPGVPDTLVVGGYVSTTDGIEWGISAFNDITGDLANAGYGDIVIPVSGQGQVVGVTAGPGWVGVAGSTLGLSSTGSSTLDSSYNNAKLLIDADKSCDLALTVPRPLELAVKGDAPGKIDLKAANSGTKSCGGTITAPKHYVLSAAGKKAPLTVAPLAAGESRTIKGATLRYTGTRRADDTVRFTLAAPADKTTTNNVASLHVVYAYCDLGLRASKAGSAPTEGARRYRFVLRNRGTDTCRGVGVGVAKGGSRTSGERPFSLDAGRSATTSILASLRRGGKVGARRAITFTVRAKSQVDKANDHVTLHPRLVGVGDSRVRGAGARGVSGSATGGKGRMSRRSLAVRSVQVAIHRLGGKRCSWIASAAGRTRSLKASKQGCARQGLDQRRGWALLAVVAAAVAAARALQGLARGDRRGLRRGPLLARRRQPGCASASLRAAPGNRSGTISEGAGSPPVPSAGRRTLRPMPLCFIEPQDAIRVIAESVGREARRQLLGELVRAWVDEIPEEELRVALRQGGRRPRRARPVDARRVARLARGRPADRQQGVPASARSRRSARTAARR